MSLTLQLALMISDKQQLMSIWLAADSLSQLIPSGGRQFFRKCFASLQDLGMSPKKTLFKQGRGIFLVFFRKQMNIGWTKYTDNSLCSSISLCSFPLKLEILFKTLQYANVVIEFDCCRSLLISAQDDQNCSFLVFSKRLWSVDFGSDVSSLFLWNRSFLTKNEYIKMYLRFLLIVA